MSIHHTNGKPLSVVYRVTARLQIANVPAFVCQWIVRNQVAAELLEERLLESDEWIGIRREYIR